MDEMQFLRKEMKDHITDIGAIKELLYSSKKFSNDRMDDYTEEFQRLLSRIQNLDLDFFFKRLSVYCDKTEVIFKNIDDHKTTELPSKKSAIKLNKEEFPEGYINTRDQIVQEIVENGNLHVPNELIRLIFVENRERFQEEISAFREYVSSKLLSESDKKLILGLALYSMKASLNEEEYNKRRKTEQEAWKHEDIDKMLENIQKFYQDFKHIDLFLLTLLNPAFNQNQQRIEKHDFDPYELYILKPQKSSKKSSKKSSNPKKLAKLENSPKRLREYIKEFLTLTEVFDWIHEKCREYRNIENHNGHYEIISDDAGKIKLKKLNKNEFIEITRQDLEDFSSDVQLIFECTDGLLFNLTSTMLLKLISSKKKSENIINS